ncbi:MAG TPA: hypothetical protein VIY73_25180, partial [Polyangiaceae bacterium]
TATKDSGPDAASSDGGSQVDGSKADASGSTPDDAGVPANVPGAAVAAGYTTNTFSSTFAKAGVDLADSRKSGFQWYLGQFFGGAPTSPSNLTFNADGTLALDGVGTNSNAGINSAAPASTAAGWVGVAFGGGAYFEATFAFNPQDTINAKGSGWPAWWAMAIEHLAGLSTQQWQGQPSGYSHFIETDFFEYDVWSFAPHTQSGGATHDWYGVWNQTCGAGGYCNVSNSGGGGSSFSNFVVQTPSATDYTQFHRFGYLWIPATATSKGSATYYFDGQPTNDTITWSQYSGSESPPPGSAPWTFGVLDQQHVALILGTGANEPMTLQSVTVWQKSAAENLTE